MSKENSFMPGSFEKNTEPEKKPKDLWTRISERALAKFDEATRDKACLLLEDPEFKQQTK